MKLKTQRNNIAKQLFKKPAGKFEPINMQEYPHPNWMTRAFKNNRYVVMIDDNAQTTHGKAIRIMIQKHDDSIINSHWQEIQNIKNELFGKETTAIEYYPAESKLINDHNIYWIWIFPEGVLPLKK